MLSFFKIHRASNALEGEKEVEWIVFHKDARTGDAINWVRTVLELKVSNEDL